MLIKNTIKSSRLIILIAFVLLNPQLLIDSVKNGMLICYNSVIPSLYIFMIVANYRSQPEIMNILSFPLRWYGRLLKINDKYFSGCLAVSLLGGFAVGAKYINTMKNRGYSDNALKVVSVSLINNSFSYCVFVAGLATFGSIVPGLMLYFSLISASLISAFVLSFIYQYNIVSYVKNTEKSNITIVSSITSAVDTMLIICGFVLFFNCICEALSLYTYHNKILNTIISIFIEVTCGTLNLLSFSGNNIYYLCFSLSVLPICTLCQVYHFTHNSRIIKTLLLSRLIHTPVSCMILSLLINLFPTSIDVNANISPIFFPFSKNMELSSVMFLITTFFIIATDKNKLFTNVE